MSRVTDQAQRSQALDTERSFIVSAPAGSGKTGPAVIVHCRQPRRDSEHHLHSQSRRRNG